MQISKKRELSRQSELKEYCGNGCCCQNLKFSLGQSLRQECWGPWQEARDAGMKCPGGNSKSCACVRACVCARVRMCWGKGIVTVGDKGLSAAREPMRGRITSGMGRSARTARNLYGLLRPLMERSPSLASGVYSGILQQQPTGPLALWESPRIYSLHSIQVSPRHSLL